MATKARSNDNDSAPEPTPASTTVAPGKMSAYVTICPASSKLPVAAAHIMAACLASAKMAASSAGTALSAQHVNAELIQTILLIMANI